MPAIDQHDLICKLKNLAIELRRTPTRDEFVKQVGFHRRIINEFGSYTALVQACDLDPVRSPKKINNEVFHKDIGKHLQAYKPPVKVSLEPYKRCLFIPDTHFPFIHQPTLEKLFKFAEKEQPEIIVQVGDLYDNVSHTKFPRSHNIFTPREEQAKARRQASEMWETLWKLVPDSRRIQIYGNHDLRALKRILEVYPEAEDWIAQKISELMTFPEVETIHDSREELILPGEVMVIHGYKTGLGEHRDFAMYNAVCGHRHIGSVVYRQLRDRILWELNCGLLGDPNAKGLTYTPQKISNWTLGWGWLDEYGPRFICG